MGAIQITVNGRSQNVAEGLTILGLLKLLGLDPERVAVELDRRIVRRADWARQELAAGAQVEIVHFVGGG